MFLIFKPIFIIGFGFFVKNILSGNQTPQILWVNSKKLVLCDYGFFKTKFSEL